MVNVINLEWKLHPRNPNRLKIHSCNNESLKIISRIGSASMNGRVYEAEHIPSGVHVALKIMLETNSRESIIAHYLGTIEPLYFPRVISWNICSKVMVRKEEQIQTDTFIELAEREYIKKAALERMEGTLLEKKRYRIQLKKIHSSGNVLFNDMLNLGIPQRILDTIKTHEGIPMLVMSSELMYGDLKTLTEEDKYHKDIPRIISEVFAGLETMVKRHIVHEDLHLGNVLLRKDSEGRLTATIHDFGESTENRSPYEHIRDIRKFLHALLLSPVSNIIEELIASGNLVVDILTQKGEMIDEQTVLKALKDLQMAFDFNSSQNLNKRRRSEDVPDPEEVKKLRVS